MDVIEAIRTRRTAGQWRPDVPARDLVEKLLESAVHAPNHHATQPWRFFVMTGEARERFGEVLADAFIRRAEHIESSKLQAQAAAERNKPLRAPVVILVAARHTDNPRIVAAEDIQACSAAIQNILLAAHSLGLSAAWKTGQGLDDSRVKAHLGLSNEDTLVGQVYLGYATEEAKSSMTTRHRSFSDLTEWMGWAFRS